jgi:hypothetical protein
MKRMLAWLVVATAMGFHGSTARADDGALAWSYRYVLVMSTVDGELAPVVSGIAHDARLRDAATCDLLAEVLLRLKARKIAAKDSGPLILLVLSGAPAPGRYRGLIDDVDKYLDQPEAKVYLLKYRRQYGRAKDAQYVPGTVDLEALRRGYVEAARAAKPTMAQATALASLPESTTMDDLFARVGKPAHVVSRDAHPAAHVIDLEIRQLWFFYRGIGRVTYDYRRADSRWHLVDPLIDTLAFEGLMPYRGDSADAPLASEDALGIAQLASGNPASIKVSAQAAYTRGNPSREYLDTAAELLLRHYEEIGNTRAVDAYGWICNVLADVGGTRYGRVLATVQKHSKDDKLSHFARRHLSTLSGDKEPYVPGSVSLAEQARKYPTPYPEITLVRGTT